MKILKNSLSKHFTQTLPQHTSYFVKHTNLSQEINNSFRNYIPKKWIQRSLFEIFLSNLQQISTLNPDMFNCDYSITCNTNRSLFFSQRNVSNKSDQYVIHRISLDTNIKQNIHTNTKHKNHIGLGHSINFDLPSVWFIDTRLKKKRKEKKKRNGQKQYFVYEHFRVNTSAICQHAAHTTDWLSFRSC